MTLTADRIQAALSPRPVRFYACVDSTNDLAMDWLRQGASSGSLVIADEQVRGRGRLGRTWYTPPGTALIVSMILRPSLAHVPRMTMLGALAICQMLEQIGAADASIKWPNDVQLRGRKVSGVLPEIAWNGVEPEGVVLGMGINVRIDFSRTELAEQAISIEPALGRAVERLDLLVRLLDRIDYWYARLENDPLLAAWRSRLNTLGRVVSVMNAAVPLEGVAESVDEDGALLVRTADGALHRVIAGDIVLGKRSF